MTCIGRGSKHHRVIVVGGGVAGLSAATRLHRLGIRDVLVLERERRTGGAPCHIHNKSFGWREFRMPMSGPSYAARLRAAVPSGVEILERTQVLSLGRNGELEIATESGIDRLRGERIILATGTRESHRHARLVSGARPFGIMAYGPLLRYIHFAGCIPFRRPVIIGSELVSLASLPTLNHAGIAPVALVEEHDRSTAPEALTRLFSRVYRVPVYRRTRLEHILGKDRVRGVILERDGRRSEIECDGVLFTGRFVPESHLVQRSHLAFEAGSFGPETDAFQRLSDPAYFACGNVLRPVEGSWVCSAEGERAAEMVYRSLAGPLPSPETGIRVETSEPIRFVWPQKIHPAADGGLYPETLSVSFRRPVSGSLRLYADDRLCTARSVRAMPEQRVRLSIEKLPERFESLEIRLESNGGTPMNIFER